ncbi:MAG: Coenzyme F420 hydrogenase/dehydrogenase, beta subunit C-terminal domain [Bacilli bacterium]|jgi:coenzyme F420-reducing hydrogenase beta subunit|nr:Coenzyme F420 hydrogenase/dehydrogenase, beta subunit C-terminal domain [Bacilli bacterium]
MSNFVANPLLPVDCYASRNKDLAEVATSRSGATFIALANYFINNGGVVYGVTLTKNGDVVYRRASDKKGIDSFKGSKYVQSNPGDSFSKCLDDLLNGKYVLFTGTPCYVHGLLYFLKSKKICTSKLITCDIVCHGTPSPLIWKLFWNRLNKSGPVTSFSFRDKAQSGWRCFEESYIQNGEKHLSKDYQGPWTKMFCSHDLFRESCFSCPFTTPYRESDFTIGDYWGIEDNAPYFDDNKGVNLLLVRSDKGRMLLKRIAAKLEVVPTQLSTSLQTQLCCPAKKNVSEYDQFWDSFFKDRDKTISKYFFPNCFHSFFSNCKSFVKKVFVKLGFSK